MTGRARVGQRRGGRVLRAFFDGERLLEHPAQHTKRLVVLRHLAETVFERKRKYPEKEVNQLLAVRHPDAASLRRYLVDEGFMARKNSVYRLRPRKRLAGNPGETPARRPGHASSARARARGPRPPTAPAS